MATDPSSRQRQFRTSRVDQAPAPGPWPQATPVGEVAPPSGANYRGYTDDDASQGAVGDFVPPGGEGPAAGDPGMPPAPVPPAPPLIGVVTVTGPVAPVVGQAAAYMVALSGNVQNPNMVLTTDDAAAVIMGNMITFSAVGNFTITATVTAQGAADSPATGTLAVVPVAVAPAPPANVPAVATGQALNFIDNTNGAADAADRTFIQTAFDAAVARVNSLWRVSGDSLNSVLAVAPGWEGMICEECELVNQAGGLLAFWGMTPARYTNQIARTGVMGVNIAQIDANGGAFSAADFATIITHELIHGLGIGFNWDANFTERQNPTNLANNTITPTAYPTAVGTYRTIAGDNTLVGVPLENEGGAGTAGGHWDDNARVINGINHPAVTNDLMIGFAAPGNPNIVTQLTLDAVGEYGYEIIGAAEGAPVAGFGVRTAAANEVAYGKDTIRLPL